jgi:maltose alpha-D-glucosyltransferase/alpha-amylase
MHAVLAQPTDDPDFAPETASEADAASWAETVSERLATAFDRLEDRAFAEEADADLGRRLLAAKDGLFGAARRLAAKAQGSARTRIHGDLHLGQVLVSAGDVTFIDFEGEPTRPLAERRAKSSPLRDVAGVLRSFDYAAAVAEAEAPAESREGHARAVELMSDFRRRAPRAFLDGYAAGGGRADGPLLELFLLEKAAYEVAYEADNRPDWLRVPLKGLAALADRLGSP